MQGCRRSQTEVWRFTCRTHCRMSAETPVLPVTPNVAAVNYGATPRHCCCSGGEQGQEVLCASCSSGLWQLAPEKWLLWSSLKLFHPMFALGEGLLNLPSCWEPISCHFRVSAFPSGGWLCKALKTHTLSLWVRSREWILHPGSQNPPACCTMTRLSKVQCQDSAQRVQWSVWILAYAFQVILFVF